MAERFVVLVEKIRYYYQGYNNFQHFLLYAINNNDSQFPLQFMALNLNWPLITLVKYSVKNWEPQVAQTVSIVNISWEVHTGALPVRAHPNTKRRMFTTWSCEKFMFIIFDTDFQIIEIVQHCLLSVCALSSLCLQWRQSTWLLRFPFCVHSVWVFVVVSWFWLLIK